MKVFNKARRNQSRVSRKPARALRFSVESLENRTLFSTLNFVVNTLSPTSGSATATSGGIVDAVNAANADTTDSAVSITFDSSVFTGVARTMQLTAGLSLHPTNSSLLVTIDATSVGGVTIDGGGTATDLSLSAGTTNLTDLTLTNGFASDGLIGNGGGIYNTATLNLTNCTISGNMANGAGGGGGGGAGVYNTGTLTILNSTISDNTAFGSDNVAYGGGILDTGTLSLTNSTVANNASANNGGGIFFAAGSHATLVNDTVTGNGILSFGSGAGLYNGSGSAISLTNTIVAENAANGDLAAASGSTYTGSFDIIGDGSGLSNLTNSQNNQYPANLPLAPLNFYGGPTETVALLGTPFVGTSAGAPTTDQRGFARGGSVDIGAYQSQTTAVDFLVTTANDPGVPGLMSLRGAIDLANLQTSNVAITFASDYGIQMTVPTALDLNNTNADETITIDATSAGGTTVSGGGVSSNFSDIEIDNGTVNLTDLTISNGNTDNSGGGIYNDSTLTVTNCAFTNDSAGEEGGGLDNEDNLTIANCAFTNNSANYGGGLYNDATLNMSDTSINNNSLTGTGGGAGFGNEGEATITDCTITDNSGSGNGDVGGGILNYYLLTITGGAISGNSATNNGGGIDDEGTALSVTNGTVSDNTSANGGGVYSDATTTITSCQLTGNTSTGTGGGISDTAASTVSVDRTTLSGNSATGNGGGIFNPGTLAVTNSTLSANVSAADGGGIAHLGGTSNIVNCTLSGNSDGGGGGLGGGIAAINAGVSVLNSTLSGNSASSSGSGIYMGNPVLLVNTIIANSPNGSDLSGTVAAGSVNNLIDDAATGSGLTDGVGGNIIDHPASLGALASNGGPTQTFSLLAGSLALNAGTSQALTALGATASSTDTTLNVVSSSGFGIGLYVKIDNEIMLITGIPSSTTLTVLRGQLSTTAAAHQSEAPITLATDQRGDTRSALTPDIGAFEGPQTVTPISLGTLPITQSTLGQAYTSTIAISNSVGALSDFTFTGLPTGLSATLNGHNIDLSGTPAQTGVFTLHASVTDSTEAVATGTYTLTINSGPGFTSTAVVSAIPGTAYIYNIVTHDVGGNPVTITASTLPTWLTLTDHGNGTATLSGTPLSANAGSNPVVLNVSDGVNSTNQSFSIGVGSTPTVATVMPSVTTASVRPTLSILGADTGLLGEAGLTYTWSVARAPSGAKPVKFSVNGTNAAQNATVRVQKDGTYVLNCVITNSIGNSVTASVELVIEQVATSLRLTPHARAIAAGASLQYGGVALDQFGRAMRTTPTTTYAVKSSNGTIDDDGLFTAGQTQGHAVIQITVDGLIGTLGATIL